MSQFIHKISGVDYKTSVHVVIPHNIVEELGIAKGDFVQIGRKNDEIVIKKLLSEKDLRPDRNMDINFITDCKESPHTITRRLISREGSIDTGISTGPEFT